MHPQWRRLLHEVHSLHPESLEWKTSQKIDCSYADPQLSQRMAKSPDRSAQPFLHPPEFDVETPQVAFMQLLIDNDEDAIFNLFQLITY